MTSVASHSISSVRPDIAAHKSHKEQPSDGSFEAMLDSALPDPGNERRRDDGARKSAPSAAATSDAPASSPGEPPPAKSANTSGATAADGKAGSKPANAQADDEGVGTCEDEQDFALAEDAVDAVTDDVADALVTPELALATTPAPDASAGTPTCGGNPPAVVVPAQTDVATSNTPPATNDAIAVKPATTPALAATDSVDGTKTKAQTAPVEGTLDISKQVAALGDQAATIQTNADTSAPKTDAEVDAAADPTSAKAPDTAPNSPAPASAAADNSTVPHDAARAATPAAAGATGTETVTAQATAPEKSDDTSKDAKGSEKGRPEDVKGRGPEGAERKPELDARMSRGPSPRQGPPGSEQGVASRSSRATEVLAEKAPQAPGGNSNAGENKDAEAKPGHAHLSHVTVDLPGAQPAATDALSLTSATTTADATALDSNRAAAPQPLAAAPVTTTGTPTPNTPYAAANLVPVSGLAVEIAAQARDGKSRFEIRLDPPELGRIDVHLHIDRDGTVTSRLVVERSETLDLLKRDAPTLERALQNAGLKTGDQGLAFSLRDHGTGRQDNGQAAGASRVIIPDDAQPLSLAGNTYGRRLGLGTGVDIRV